MNIDKIKNTIIANTSVFDAGHVQDLVVEKNNSEYVIVVNPYSDFQIEFLNAVFRAVYPTQEELPNTYRSPAITPKVLHNRVVITATQIRKAFKILNWHIIGEALPSLCMFCHTEFIDGDILPVSDYRLVCKNCIKEYYECKNCQLFKHPIQARKIDTESHNTYCGWCVAREQIRLFTCDSCSKFYENERGKQCGDYLYCKKCFKKYCKKCSLCSQEFQQSSYSLFCEDLEKFFCSQNCFNQHTCDILHLRDHENNDSDVLWNRIYDSKTERKSALGVPSFGDLTRNSILTFYKGEKQAWLGSNRFVGVEIEVEKGRWVSKIASELPENSIVKQDGSIVGFELNTPPASGDKLEEIIRQSCEVLKKHKYQGTASCGLHIHIDARDIINQPNKIANIARTYLAIEDMIFSILPPSRWTSQYCQPIQEDFLLDYKNLPTINRETVREKWFTKNSRFNLKDMESGRGKNDRYHGLNIASLENEKRGTIELRYHSGTTSATKIINWIALNLHLFEYAINHFKLEEMRELFDMETGQRKFEQFCKVFKISVPLRQYLIDRASLFNPEWNIKFNKGKLERVVEETIHRQYHKILKKEIKTITKEEFVKLQKIQIAQYGKQWRKHFNKNNALRTAQDLAKQQVQSYLMKKFGTTKLKSTFGLTTEKELRKQTNLLRNGMLLAVNAKFGKTVDDEFDNEMKGLIR